MHKENKFMQTQTTLRPYPGAMLDPKHDPIFKSLFTQNTEDSQKALTAFLSVILSQQIINVTLGQNELPIESEKDKQSIFDLSCYTADSEKVMNVEMQGLNIYNSFDKRSEYHVAHLLNHYVTKGLDWDKVPSAIMISVLNFVYDSNDESGLLKYSMRKEDGTTLESSRLMIVYLELPKYDKVIDEPIEKLTAVEKWAKFFLYANCKEKADYVRKLVDSEEGIMYAMKALDSISQSDEEWRRERDYIDAVNTEISIRNTAIREGVKQGIEQGIAQGFQQGIQQGLQQGIQQGARENAIESAKNFLKMKIGSYEQIAQGTGLTLEEVMKLAEEIK